VDLALYLRVIWRFRVVVVLGIMLGSFLALISTARIQFDGLEPTLTSRQEEVWLSASTLFVTERGFPWGRTIFDETVKVEGANGEPTFVPRFADPGRLSGLAVLYAELAKSDEVRREFLEHAPRGASYEPVVVKSADGGSVLPLIYMKGFGPTPEIARFAAERATAAFRSYLDEKQAAARIPQRKRVEVVVTNRGTAPELFEPRSVVRPIFLFLLVVMAAIALAFVLENVRPRAGAPGGVRPVAPAPDSQQPVANTKRSA
jgi:hypothetical protein